VAHLVYMGVLCRAVVRFNQHAWGRRRWWPRSRATRRCDPHAASANEASVNVSAFNQFPSYVQLQHGGYNHYNFAEGFPS